MATKKLVLPELFSPGFAGGGMLMSNRNVLDKSTGVPDVISVEAQNMIRDKVLASQPKAAPTAPAAPVAPTAPVGDGKIYTTDKSVFNEQPAQGGQFNFPLGELLARVGGLTGDVIKGDTENKTQGAITDTIASGQKMRTAKDMSMPDSDVSKRYQKIASGIFGGKDFSGWAAADFDKFMPEFKDLFDKQNAPAKGAGGGSGGGGEGAKSGQDVVGFEPVQGVNIDKTKITKANEISSNLASTMPVLKTAIDKYEKVSEKGLGGIAEQFTDAEFQSIKNGLTGLLRTTIVGPGTLSDSDRALIKSVIDDPVPSRALTKLRSVADRTVASAEGAARGYGFKPSGNFNYLMYGDKQPSTTTMTSAPQTAKAPSAGQQAVKLGEALAEKVAKVSPSAPAKAAPAMVTMEKDGKRRQVPADMVSVYEKQGAKVVR